MLWVWPLKKKSIEECGKDFLPLPLGAHDSDLATGYKQKCRAREGRALVGPPKAAPVWLVYCMESEGRTELSTGHWSTVLSHRV